ncbi:MAG: hydrogenase maturation nickel metallochaperone HypA [Tepidisphaeraceae bacterium]
MHELSIALSILDCAAEESERRGGAKVLAIHLKLGPLSGVVKEALVSAYGLASEVSEFPDSRLVIEDVPVVAYCPACAAEREIASIQEMCCPVCHTPTPDIRSGREMEVTALEICDRAIESLSH